MDLYTRRLSDKFLQAQGYILHTKRRGEKATVIGIGEAVYPAAVGKWKESFPGSIICESYVHAGEKSLATIEH